MLIVVWNKVNFCKIARFCTYIQNWIQATTLNKYGGDVVNSKSIQLGAGRFLASKETSNCQLHPDNWPIRQPWQIILNFDSFLDNEYKICQFAVETNTSKKFSLKHIDQHPCRKTSARLFGFDNALILWWHRCWEGVWWYIIQSFESFLSFNFPSTCHRLRNIITGGPANLFSFLL